MSINANDMTRIPATNRADLSFHDEPEVVMNRELPKNDLVYRLVMVGCSTFFVESFLLSTTLNAVVSNMNQMFQAWLNAGSPHLF